MITLGGSISSLISINLLVILKWSARKNNVGRLVRIVYPYCQTFGQQTYILFLATTTRMFEPVLWYLQWDHRFGQMINSNNIINRCGDQFVLKPSLVYKDNTIIHLLICSLQDHYQTFLKYWWYSSLYLRVEKIKSDMEKFQIDRRNCTFQKETAHIGGKIVHVGGKFENFMWRQIEPQILYME